MTAKTVMRPLVLREAANGGFIVERNVGDLVKTETVAAFSGIDDLMKNLRQIIEPVKPPTPTDDAQVRAFSGTYKKPVEGAPTNG